MVQSPNPEGTDMALKIASTDTPIDGIITAEDSQKFKEVVDFLTTPGVIWDAKDEDGNVITKGALDNPNRQLILIADSKGDAEQYQGYARAWGMRQDPKIDIRKAQSKGAQPGNEIRSNVKTVDPTKPQPGRKPNQPTTPDSTQAQAVKPADTKPDETPQTPQADAKASGTKK